MLTTDDLAASARSLQTPARTSSSMKSANGLPRCGVALGRSEWWRRRKRTWS